MTKPIPPSPEGHDHSIFVDGCHPSAPLVEPRSEREVLSAEEAAKILAAIDQVICAVEVNELDHDDDIRAGVRTKNLRTPHRRDANRLLWGHRRAICVALEQIASTPTQRSETPRERLLTAINAMLDAPRYDTNVDGVWLSDHWLDLRDDVLKAFAAVDIKARLTNNSNRPAIAAEETR